MKSCPTCKRVFPDEAGFCPEDGTPLVTASLVPASAPDDPRIGRILMGRYDLRRVVADGGMGRVYEGIDRQTNTRIAVKVLHEDVARDEVSLERFKREYSVSAKLPHDHIVNVLDFQRDPELGVWLLVMEFLDGEELRVILKREISIPPERLIRMLSQAAIALDASHQMQIVHRDLKPDNLFLCGTREGDVLKVLDFGSVKDKRENAKKLTVLGTTIGSPYYMAPEQAQGLETLDARADVFALGAITYECVTGSVPFTGSNGPSILLAIMTKEPDPPSERARGGRYPVAPKMDEVIEHALAKNPNIRTKSVGDLADAVGHAYGLTGMHRDWAVMPQATLAETLRAAHTTVMASAARPSISMSGAIDPFATAPARASFSFSKAIDPFATPGAPGAPPDAAAIPSTLPRAMDEAFEASRLADAEVDSPVVPSRPAWMIPLFVGLAALVLGGGLALVFVLAR